MKNLTDPKESATRKRIDAILNNLNWKTDESRRNCNVFTERAKTREQHKSLAGFEPDYVLYESGTDNPIAIIEAKRSGESLGKALDQAITQYATPLKINIVVVADGAIIETHDRRDGKNLRLDGELVTSLLTEKQLLRHIKEGSDINTPDSVRHTKQELIKVFGEANSLLRKEGLREGIERFTEFSNLLFLKLISEIEDDREHDGEARNLEKKYCWKAFCDKPASEMLDYINDTILPRLVNRYNHSGDVFQQKLLITNPDILKRIVDKLGKLTLLDTDSDIKGDAFEYFLKNSISVGNDLGEYFTPRHVVKLIVDLVDPKFGETVYDPACGTGGFLIQAFRHIKNKISMTPGRLKTLKEKTVYGRELTGTAKIAKMNMIIIGDGHTNIEQKDSLNFPVKFKYDVVLANYPFSQNTDYAAFYGLVGESANPVFLKHIIDALKKGGRAGVVVPKGMLFDESAQCTKIRRILLETCEVEAVIDLHNFVFRPYTGQPTSILIFKKGHPTKSIWFFQINNDGYRKTSSKKGRSPIKENDLPVLRQLWSDKPTTNHCWSASIGKIIAKKYSLSADEYRSKASKNHKYIESELYTIADVKLGKTPRKEQYNSDKCGHKILKYRDIEAAGKIDWTNNDEGWIEPIESVKRQLREIQNGDILLVASGHTSESIGTKAAFVIIPPHITKPVYFVGELLRIRIFDPAREILPSYLLTYLMTLDGYAVIQKCVKGMHLTQGRAKKIKIVTPDFRLQKQLIKKIKSFQDVIDNCYLSIEKSKKKQVKTIQTFLKSP